MRATHKRVQDSEHLIYFLIQLPTTMTSENAPLGAAVLKPASGPEIKAGDLWSESPVLVVVLRRPGCCE